MLLLFNLNLVELEFGNVNWPGRRKNRSTRQKTLGVRRNWPTTKIQPIFDTGPESNLGHIDERRALSPLRQINSATCVSARFLSKISFVLFCLIGVTLHSGVVLRLPLIPLNSAQLFAIVHYLSHNHNWFHCLSGHTVGLQDIYRHHICYPLPRKQKVKVSGLIEGLYERES